MGGNRFNFCLEKNKVSVFVWKKMFGENKVPVFVWKKMFGKK